MTPAERLSESYRRTLGEYLSSGGESALSEAYEIGRQMLAQGIGLLGVLNLHHDAMQEWLESHDACERSAAFSDAAVFLKESLSSFELHFRRIDESTAAWRRVTDLLEEEARRIAHALHNEAGSILVHAALEMDMVMTSLPEELRSQLALARGLLDETGEQLRHLSHELRPAVLDDFGLESALEFLAEGIERRTGVRVCVEGKAERRLPPEIELAVYRIAQEAINNTLRHAGKSASVSIRLEIRKGWLHCSIADDGVGFDIEDMLACRSRATLGLVGMRERAAVLGGECRIESCPGRGTTVDLTMPL